MFWGLTVGMRVTMTDDSRQGRAQAPELKAAKGVDRETGMEVSMEVAPVPLAGVREPRGVRGGTCSPRRVDSARVGA